ncbi:hypothetical protein KAH94_00780 [bacterium]|nr:hypothetical protein [bacterium]
MKSFLLPFLLFVTITPHSFGLEPNPSSRPEHIPEAHQCHCPPDIDEEGAAVLTQFAGMVCSFVNILQSPHNSANVGSNLGKIVHGLGNIISIAIKRGQPIAEYIQTDEFKEKMEHLIVSKICEID